MSPATQSPLVPQPPSPAIGYLVIVIVAAVILAFAILFGAEVWSTWHGPAPAWAAELQNPSSILASLVGGVVAIAFAIKAPPLGNRSLISRNIVSLGAAGLGGKIPYKSEVILGGVYATVYVLLGLAALFTWARWGSATLGPVKTLGTSFGGMVTPIVVAFFNQP